MIGKLQIESIEGSYVVSHALARHREEPADENIE